MCVFLHVVFAWLHIDEITCIYVFACIDSRMVLFLWLCGYMYLHAFLQILSVCVCVKERNRESAACITKQD